MIRVLAVAALLLIGTADAHAAAPRPVFGHSVVASVLSGTVLIGEPGAPAAIRLTGTRVVRLGSTIEATDGSLRLLAAAARHRTTQSANFVGGPFAISQEGSGIVDARLLGGQRKAEACAVHASRVWAFTARRRYEVDRVRVRTTPPGRFRLMGEYSAASDPGAAEWTVVDYCEATQTSVAQGNVTVHDFVLQRSVPLTAGQSYTAAPLALTGEAVAVTQTTAQLVATVDPNGSEVTGCAFEYGPTQAFGETALCSESPGGGFAPVQVSTPLAELPSNTTIYFRTIASNKNGTSDGAAKTFRTLPYPPAASTGKASNVTPMTATLNATVDPGGAALTSCEFQYGLTVTYGQRAACASLPGPGQGASAVAAAVIGLPPATRIHFRVLAANGGGTHVGADHSFETPLAPPTVVIDEPSDVTQFSVTLQATVDPNGAPVTTCEFEFGKSTAYGEALPCPTPTGAGDLPVQESLSLGGRSPDETIHYRLVTANRQAIVSSGDQVVETLPLPPEVSVGTATEITPTTWKLTGTVVTPAEITSCQFVYGEAHSFDMTSACEPPPIGDRGSEQVSSIVEGLNPSSAYQWRIIASDKGGTSESEGILNTPPYGVELGEPKEENGKISIPATVTESCAGAVVHLLVSWEELHHPFELELELTATETHLTFEYAAAPENERLLATCTGLHHEQFHYEIMKIRTKTEPEGIEEHPGGGHRPTLESPGAEEESPSQEVKASGRIPTPVLGKLVDAFPVSGTVFERPARANATLAGALPVFPFQGSYTTGYSVLSRPAQIPVGSELDTTHGVVKLIAASAAGGLESAELGGGGAQVLQSRRKDGLLELQLIDLQRSDAACGERPGRGNVILGRLNIRSEAELASRGRFSVTEGRNAVFSVADRCDGTQTTVTRGRAVVRALTRGKTVSVLAGHRLLVR